MSDHEPLNAEAEALVAKLQARIQKAREELWENGIVLPDEMVAEMLAAKERSINARKLLPSFGKGRST